MKALTLWQPWASLIAVGAKTIETRSWGTAYRGPIAIHAGLKNCDWDSGVPGDQLVELCKKHHIHRGSVPRGVIVCTAELWNCWQVGDGPCPIRYSVHERHLGDFGWGRWLWFLRNVRRLAPPVPCRGARGLFDVPDEMVGV